ncbi:MULTISPECIES: glycerol-3-phosphate dehydrogenase/oxidase [Marinobacter]|uniref:Glycerol-3-phosphate dehydrogenase/oxidase n=1 Tax=Marinobacter xiaoshiensis TaxID=3073652 RepID=A0ABU2HGZ3_9GAMM|nr:MULTISPECIES: glycerol-3-phosphate dehydrogenase/oxidase [unclassified Marinobacter]MBK1887827.1 glycerol-3-phosphate dehydrogenase/oxidase [Marinobacter sp. DY40_1A1]MDS1310345.1 glycerol-3-phosphate dehydrogenase/oxidase [Marinobacter sp. F60267]
MNRRDALLRELKSSPQAFDVVVIGGGITGAGIAREAAGSGLKTLLVEQKDFAWGTSSRSSKMVHGGLRYLGSGQYGLTRDAVTERQRLMTEAPGLIDPLRFIMPHFQRQFPGPRLFQILLRVYDWIAHSKSRHLLTPGETMQWVPGLNMQKMIGASGFTDAVTDDARLVQRVISEARQDGAWCLNYVKAVQVLRTNGKVSGLELKAEDDANTFAVDTPVVINATGVWADRLQQSDNGEQPMTIRPLRGSHLVLPWKTLPISCTVSLLHPDDKRPVFAFPWAGTTVLGTTDLDHTDSLDREPRISAEEVDYLLRISNSLFPGAGISKDDVISTWAGVRPVVTAAPKPAIGNAQSKAPSKESREHEFREDKGLISIAGGKLTTFRLIAREALTRGLGGNEKLRPEKDAVFRPTPVAHKPGGITHQNWQRLTGFYGADLASVLKAGPAVPVSNSSGLASIPGELLWAEVTWACLQEDVKHLDDLMLRRTRLGLIVPEGGKALLPALKQHCQSALNWDDEHWHAEEARYLALWSEAYSLPGRPEPKHAA